MWTDLQWTSHVITVKCLESHVDFLQIWSTWIDKWKCKWGPWGRVCACVYVQSILYRIILKRKHGGYTCYHSHFPHHRGPELFISAPLRDLDKTVVCIDISHAGKLLRHPVLWLQTCTSDQHLIRHTQACLKSNLEQISHDSWILWTWLRSIHMRSVWITTMLHRSISSACPSGERLFYEF